MSTEGAAPSELGVPRFQRSTTFVTYPGFGDTPLCRRFRAPSAFLLPGVRFAAPGYCPAPLRGFEQLRPGGRQEARRDAGAPGKSTDRVVLHFGLRGSRSVFSVRLFPWQKRQLATT
jgi:hypothetical protein